MYTKSLIQQRLEAIDAVNSLKAMINNLMENYIVENSVFGLYGNKPYEANTGYFIEVKTFDSLDECVRNMNPTQFIQVLENKTFVLGNMSNCLSNCPHDAKVFDVEYLQQVR